MHPDRHRCRRLRRPVRRVGSLNGTHTTGSNADERDGASRCSTAHCDLPEWVAGLMVIVVARRADSILLVLVVNVGSVLLLRGTVPVVYIAVTMIRR